MKWNTLSVDAEMGIKEGMPCEVCGFVIHDLVFFPANAFSEQLHPIISAWMSGQEGEKKGPELFYVCRECLAKLDPQFRF